MRWMKPTFTFLIVLLAFAFIQTTTAITYHLAKNTTIKNGLKVQFGDYWISTSGTDITVTTYFVSNWLNYTSNAGTQQIHNGTKPYKVYFDDVEQAEGDKWTYGAGTTTITPSGTNVSLLWGPQTFGSYAAYATDYLVYGNPSDFILEFANGSSLAFQNDIEKTLTLYIATGLLNSSQATLRLYSGGGYLRFVADNNTDITINYDGIDTVKVSGDQNNTLRSIISGSTIAVTTNNNVLIQWDITLAPLFPILFTLGITGLVGMFAGPAYAIWKIKERQYFTAFSTGTLVTTLGVALFMAWLWGA